MGRYLIWDFDGTLATRRGGWNAATREVIAREFPDARISAQQLRPHFRTGFPWHSPEYIRPPETPDEWWAGLDPVFARVLEHCERVDAYDTRRFTHLVRAAYLERPAWLVYEDTVPALSHLRSLGWKHVVLSNHVPELDCLIADLGLADLLEAAYSSGTTGKEKPNPAAFECVFEDHPDSRAGWMIGDNWNADVRGAAAVGMRAILVRGQHVEARHQCDTLGEVERLVGSPTA